MAQLGDAGTWAGGKVRDVSERMLSLTASKQPYNAMVKKGRRIFNSTPEWPFEAEPTADTTPLADAAAVTSAEFADYESLFGMLQGRAVWHRRAFGIGKKAQAMTHQHGGTKDKFKQYGVITMKAFNRDLEAINLGTQDSWTETVSGQARTQTRGLFRWLGCEATPTDLSIPTAARCPAGNKITNRATASAVTEDDVRNVMKSIADTTKRTDGSFVLFCTTGLKATFSGFAYSQSNNSNAVMPLRRFNQNAGDKTIMLDVTAYEGDFGKLKLHPHFDLPNGINGTISSYATVYAATSDNGYGRTAAEQKMDAAHVASVAVHGYLVDLDAVELNMVQGAQMGTLPDDGSGPRGYVDAIWVHSVLNPQRHGAFYYKTA